MRNQRIGCLRTIWGPSLQLFVFVGLVNSLFAQSATQETWHIVWRNDGSALQAGPDTNNPADLTQMLNDAQVRSELERTSALDCGRLGELVGVYENQKSRLYDREAKIRAEVELEAAKLKSEAEDRILALLTDEQRKKFRLLVGGHFEFQDTSEIQVRAQGYLEKRRKAVLESLREGK